ncbi:MAG: class I SAM-dependent methyltransferase [Alphaproteobacteria bacterium]|nr:class I SAM-dependent methyltransferase [Alphaproteobacteria bacterium]
MSWDPVWENVFQNQSWGKYPSENLVRFVARNFYNKDRANTKIIEVGFGTGANIWYLANEGFNVSGVEGSKTATQICNKMLEATKLKADLHTGDIQTFSPKEKVDGVIDIECIYANSYEDTKKILENISNSLKSGGLFFSQTFSDSTYVGKTNKKTNENEYIDISDGPIESKGLTRLMSEEQIHSLYGKYFDILSVDKTERTINNQECLISEWLIVCRKKD